MVGRSSFLGLRARIECLQTFRVLRIWGVGLLISSSENAVNRKFNVVELTFYDVGERSAKTSIGQGFIADSSQQAIMPQQTGEWSGAQ
jgi:hypothetical protein